MNVDVATVCKMVGVVSYNSHALARHGSNPVQVKGSAEPGGLACAQHARVSAIPILIADDTNKTIADPNGKREKMCTHCTLN